MYLAAKVDRVIHVQRNKLGNPVTFHAELMADIPEEVPDKIAKEYLKVYPKVFYVVDSKKAAKVIKLVEKQKAAKKNETQKNLPVAPVSDFEAVEFLNNNAILPKDELKLELEKLNESDLDDICKLLKLRLPPQTGVPRRIERILQDIEVKNQQNLNPPQ